MPELSRSFGIIRRFAEFSERHHVPRFHARYGEHVAVFPVAPVAPIIGFIPPRQQRLVEVWAELRADERLADWQLLEQGRKLHDWPDHEAVFRAAAARWSHADANARP